MIDCHEQAKRRIVRCDGSTCDRSLVKHDTDYGCDSKDYDGADPTRKLVKCEQIPRLSKGSSS